MNQQKITWKGERADEYCNLISSESSSINELINQITNEHINLYSGIAKLSTIFTGFGRKLPSGPCINKTERKV